MSISLNISSGTTSPKTKKGATQAKSKQAPPQKKGPGQPKKKSGPTNEVNDFSFNFTKQKAAPKALVAKLRNPALLLSKKNAAALNNAQQINKVGKPANAISVTPKKPSSLVPSAKLSSAKPKPDASPKIPLVVEDKVSLSLNIMQGTEADLVRTAERLEKKTLNTKQRKEKVLQKRAKQFQAQEAQAIDTTKSSAERVPESVAPKRPFEKTQNQINYEKNKLEKPKKMSSLFKNNPTVPVVGQRLVHPHRETVFTGEGISSIGLHEHAIKNLADLLQITELTTVQKRAIPTVLSGRDVLVRSQTGSGKTLAYALPIVQKLQDIRPKLSRDGGIQALVIVPTRELAIQVYELFIKLLKPYTWIVSGYLSGGEKRKAEKARLRKGINILVGTPGRLVDHLLHTESFKLDQVRWLVLDEADRLFEMGYEKDVKKIVDVLNENGVVKTTAADGEARNPFAKPDPKTIIIKPLPPGGVPQLQSMLLSATLTASVRQLAGLALKDPLFIDTTDVNEADIIKTNTFSDAIDEAVAEEKICIPATVTQTYTLVPPKLRLVTLSGLIALESRKSASTKMLVFLGTESMVDFHYDVMNEALTQKVLDSDDEVDDEEGILKKFKGGKKGAEAESEDEGDGEPAYLKGVRLFKLHGALTQIERSAVFKAFKEAKSGVLLTTDVAGRGIDVPHVDLVVQFSPPQKIADYVHRVGRTARAGRSGRAMMFLGPNETEFIRMLEEKKIRISQEDSAQYLKGVVREHSGQRVEEAASELQRKFEAIVADDKEMHDRACKAFVSWLRFVAAFPKDLRNIFNIKQTHMGHYAKSLGLREPPKSFTKHHSAPRPALPNNRLTYTERTEQRHKPEPVAKPQHAQKRDYSATGGGGPNLNFNKFIKKSISLQTSEFGSGMPAPKKKKFD